MVDGLGVKGEQLKSLIWLMKAWLDFLWMNKSPGQLIKSYNNDDDDEDDKL